MERKNYIIFLEGCADTTKIDVPLTKEEFKLLEKISGLSEAMSEYGCMPTMSIKLNES